MSDKKINLLSRYWRLLKKPSTVAMGLILGFGFIAGIVFWGAFNMTLELTNTEQFCIGCHEMKDNVYVEYQSSIHYGNRSGVRATCPDCHVPHKWSDKIVRKIQASKELWGKITGKIDTTEKFEAHRLHMAQREWQRFRENDSLECRNCHDQSYMDFSKQGAPGVYMHSVMLDKGNFTCVDCHKGIAHHIPEVKDLQQLVPTTLEPSWRPPFDHSRLTTEQRL